MIKAYKTLRSGCCVGLLLAVGTTAAQAQTRLGLQAQTLAGTYTDVGTGTGTTVIATANNDDANSAVQNIGFSFVYGGNTFTQFVLNTNGIMRLGANGPSGTAHSPYAQTPDAGPINSTNAADVNLLMPFNFDLESGSNGAEYRMATTGTAGSRVCTIQWKNVSDKALDDSQGMNLTLDKQYANFSFQVKLYEGTNQIDFVYGQAMANTGITDNAVFSQVGVKGASNLIGNDLLLIKASRTAWSGPTYASGPQQLAGVGANAFNFRSTVLPDVGRTVRFTTCAASVVSTFPYTEDFASASSSQLACSSNGTDANNDGVTWSIFASTDPLQEAGNSALYYVLNTNGTTAANDWYYTPGLSLRTGYSYKLSFKYRSGDDGGGVPYPEALEVKYGTAATPAGQTTTIFSNTNINNIAYVTTAGTQVANIVPAANGTYYIGFHAISTANQFLLLVDDLQVTETRILGVKNGVNTVFSAEASPVPFGSSLTLNLNTVQSGDLHLTLRDALGRALRQSTAKATVGSNSVAVPGVADLPAGVYFLDVEQAGQKQVLRVTHE